MPSTPVVVLGDTLTNIANAIRGKNGSQDTYKPSEMPAAITAIPSGGGVGVPKEVNGQGVYGPQITSYTFTFPSNANSIARSALTSAFYASTGLSAVNFSSLVSVPNRTSLSYAFYDCTSLASANFSSLESVSGAEAFNGAFSGCTALSSVNFSSLESISGEKAFYQAFNGCTSLTSVTFGSLSVLTAANAFYQAFKGCTSLTSLSFPALTPTSFRDPSSSSWSQSQFTSMLSGVTGCTVHFPASIQSTIGSWSTVTNGFGGTNTTVLYDL